MTDREQAEQIAKHEGWVKYCKDNWVWAVGDRAYGIFFNTLYQIIGLSDSELELSRMEQFCGLTSGANSFRHSKPISTLSEFKPIPREDQLMDMLEAKGKNSFKYFKGETKYDWTFEFQPNKNHRELPKHAPTRLLSLFVAVCKVYGLKGKVEQCAKQ